MEGDAGTSQLNPTDEQDVTSQDVVTTEPSAEESIEEPGLTGESEGAQRPARIGRGIALTVCLTLVTLAAAVGTGGWFALKSHRESQALAANETAAIAAMSIGMPRRLRPLTAARRHIGTMRMIARGSDQFSYSAARMRKGRWRDECSSQTPDQKGYRRAADA